MATQTINVKPADLERVKAEIMVRLDKYVGRVATKLALDVHANLVRPPGEGGTPVDTGWARANWIPRIKEKVTTPIGQRPTGVGEKFNDPGAAAAGAASVTGYRIDMGDIYVSNAVPYIGQLNNGTSKQAPAGFVEACIAKAVVEDSRQ